MTFFHRNRHTLIIGLLPLISLQTAKAQDWTDWRGIRSTGMGSAFTAVSNSEEAAFSNPAGIAKARNPRTKDFVHYSTFPGFSAGGNTVPVVLGSYRVPSPQKSFESFAAAARTQSPSTVSFELQFFPAVILGEKRGPLFLLGLPNRQESRIHFTDKDDLQSAKVRYSRTTTAVLGLSDSSQSTLFSYGLVLRPMQRVAYDNPALASENLSWGAFKKELSEESNQTTALGVDAGILITAADFWFPTLGISVRNIPTGCVTDYINPQNGKVGTMCGAKHSGQINNTATSTLLDPTEVRLGFSITPRFRVFDTMANIRMAADFFPLPVRYSGKHYGLQGLDFNDILHTGGEVFFGNPHERQGVGVRLGLSHGQHTFGATTEFLGLTLEYASYALRGETAGAAQRRHLIGLSGHW